MQQKKSPSSLLPEARRRAPLAYALVDAVAIAGIIALAILDDLDSSYAMAATLLIAGVGTSSIVQAVGRGK